MNILFCLTLFVSFLNQDVVDKATEEKNDVPKKHQGEGRIYNASAGFSVVPPSEWKEVKKKGIAVMNYRGPVLQNSPNLNVRVVGHDGTPLKKVAEVVKRVLSSRFNDYKIVDEKFLKQDGKDAFMLIATFEVDGKKVQNLQYMIALKKKAFILTYTSTPEYFKENRKLLEESAMSTLVD